MLLITLIVCTTVLFVSACITYCSIKEIAAYVYTKTVTVVENIEDPLPKSPYSICRSTRKSGGIGYAILKHGEPMYIIGTEKYVVYDQVKDALKDINIYEKIDGVKLTQLD